MAGRSSDNRYEEKEIISAYVLLMGLIFMAFALCVLAGVVLIVAMRWAWTVYV